jgi:2-polyprenyl-6-methoxyphenol hydroxylase-like FAD-dependent oxidoreductase
MTADVIIAGGGPNGLLMACELSLAGVRPIVLERLQERSTIPKANGLVGQVVQALDYRGLYQSFSNSDEPPQPAPGFQFGALALDSQPMYLLPIPQRRIEEILERHAIELGAQIRRGHEVIALSQDSDHVTIDVNGPSGRYRMKCQYLVAADGGRSAIRKQLGIGFPGITDDSFVGLMGQASILPPVGQPETGELDVPGIGRLKSATFVRTEKGMFAFGMFQPGIYRFAVYEWDQARVNESVPVTVTEANETLSRVLGARVQIASSPNGEEMMLRRSGEGINSRQADRYRDRRVFLVGDAAHVHSGVGGPGLNLGMQDVINLGWKLGAQIKGWAPESLLDTYESERRPVGERVLMHTRAQMALLSPGPNITALRQVLEELLRNPDNTRHIGEMMAGTDICYKMGDDGGEAHLAGRWMPDLILRIKDGITRVAELMRVGRPILLDLTGGTEVLHAASDWADRVDVVQATAAGPATALLIRPDGYVAWATDAETGFTGLRTALAKWFGRPAAASLSL